MKIIGAYFLIIFSIVEASSGALHPYSVSWVNADLQEDKISLSIKITAEDLLYFHQLEMDSLFNIGADILKKAAQDHAQIILSNFFIQDQDKKQLPGNITNISLSSIQGGKQFDVMELMKFPLVYYLDVELYETTELLTFNQTLGNDGVPAVSTLSITKNGNMLVSNVQISKENSFTMARDAISFGDKTEMNVMLSYIKLSDTQVSHELTLPITLLNSFIDFNAVDPEDNLTSIKEFMDSNSDVIINGQILKPTVEALNIQNGIKDIIDDNTLVNVRISYSLKSLPKDIAISWKSFNWKMRWFESLIDDFGIEKEHTFSRFIPTFKTTRKALEKIE